MIDFHEIITEVTYRSKRGYPDFHSADDIKLLGEVLLERGFERDFVVNYIRNVRKVVTEAIDLDTFDWATWLRTEAGVSDTSPARDIEKIINGMSRSERDAFANKFRSYKDAKSWARSNDTKLFAKFFEVKTPSLGRGEIAVVMAVRNSQVGSTSVSADVIIGNSKVEVKELDPSEIRPAAKGSIGQHPEPNNSIISFKNMIESYQDGLIDYFKAHDDGAPVANALQKLVGGGSNVRSGEIKTSYLQLIYDAARALNNFVANNDVENSVHILSVDQQKKFVIDKDFADKIKANTNVSIKVGPEVDDAHTAQLVIKQIMAHKYVQKPEQLIDELKSIKQYFIGPLDGLLVYKPGSTLGVNFYDKRDFLNHWFITRVTQGEYKMKPDDMGGRATQDFQSAQLK